MSRPPGHSGAEAGQQGTGSGRVVIIGGGAAGLEAALAVRYFSDDRVGVKLFSQRQDFEIRPLAVREALGQGEILRFNLEDIAHGAGFTFENRGVSSVETRAQRVVLHDGTEVPYDYLVVATGTKSLWVVPGARTFWGPNSEETMTAVKDLLNTGKAPGIVLTMPDLTAWPLPVYELALYLAAVSRDAVGPPAEITIASPETLPLEIFGEKASRQVAGMLTESRVSFLSRTVPVAFEAGFLTTRAGDFISADAVITLPALTGRRLDGIPYDESGFIKVNSFGQVEGFSQIEDSRQAETSSHLEGLDRVYAAGDVTDYPVKFGSLATGQADVVAASIAAHALGKPKPGPFRPILSGTLLTIDGPVPLDHGDGQNDISPNDTSVGHEAWDPSRKLRGRFLTPLLSSMRDQA